MKAMRLIQNNQPLITETLSIPTVGSNEALVKIVGAGVCHSDLHLWNGNYDLGDGKQLNLSARGVPMPLTMGHEISGIVDAIGNYVTAVRKGEPVVIYPWIGCGHCDTCIQGSDQLCITPKSLGVYQDGGYAEYVKVPHEKFLINADGLDLTHACTLACSALTAYSAIKKANKSSLSTLAIMGIGGLGSIGIELAKCLTNAFIIAIDREQKKLDLAKKMGADECVLLNADTQSHIFSLTHNMGVNTVIDFVGAENTVSTALSCLTKSGHLIIVGLVGGKVSFPIPFFPLKNLTIEGSYTGTCHELRELVALAKRNIISPYISKTYTLEEANNALNNLKSGETLGRSVLIMKR